MNKKFLNAVLFGALLASSTGTFTSCKDYDDDINGLSSRVDAVEKSIADLNTKFGSLAYVKSVSFAGGVLTVTDQDGKPTTYTIPDTDTDTQYTLDVSQKEGENKATIILKKADGSIISSKDVSFTDTDTDKFDASKLTIDENGKVSYKGNPTGVTIPKQITTITEVKVEGVTVGWSINGTNLLITDALPITGFEYIPEKILANWGERVIVFEENSYKEKTIKADAVEKSVTSLFMSNVASPQYWVNPSSATIAQLPEEGKAVILKKTVGLVTRTPGTFIEWKKTGIDKGLMTVSLEADPAMFEKDPQKLDEIALQFTTKAGNKITTEYVGVINKTAEVDIVLTDKAVTATVPGTDANHFAITKVAAIAQKAMIDGNDMPLVDNSPLVQQVTYTEATTTGINLATLVSACNINDAAGHKFFDRTKYPDLKLSFKAADYTIGETPQNKYMNLDEATSMFKAVNYTGVNPSCIGKAPMVLATLTDSHNGNKIVAAAYIKLLIVADAAAKPEADITIDDNATIGLGCNNPTYKWSTNDEFMSTKVYTFSTNDKLTPLSKERFHKLYTFNANPAGLTNVGTWTVEEDLTTTDGKVNHKVNFELKNTSMEAKDYVAYAVYTKVTDPDILVSIENSGMYPKQVIIKHTVTVDAVDFEATAKTKAANAWEGNTASIYCQTPGTGNTTQIVGDLNSLFMGGKVEFDCTFNESKYPSFVAANMGYKFVFSAENLKAKRGLVKGLDDTEYQLFVVDDNKLYAVGKNLTGAAIAAACDATTLVASLSGANNNNVTYANTTVSKSLLNREPRGKDSFYAMMDIVYANECDLTVPVTNGGFNLAFIRPVNVAANSSKYFTDALNAGDNANVLNLGELVAFTDWRKDSPLNSFAAHLDYYKYYGVTKIECADRKEIETDWGGTRQPLEKAFGADVAATILKFVSNTVTPNGTILPDYGTVTYIKTSGAEIKSYKFFIPLTITYTWGTIKETIEVQVKATI